MRVQIVLEIIRKVEWSVGSIDYTSNFTSLCYKMNLVFHLEPTMRGKAVQKNCLD